MTSRNNKYWIAIPKPTIIEHQCGEYITTKGVRRVYTYKRPGPENSTGLEWHKLPRDVYDSKHYPTCEICGNKYIKKCYKCSGAGVHDKPLYLALRG